jgi:site-specific recombinase XerD
VAGCSERNIGVYRWWLDRIRAHAGEDLSALDTTTVTRFFVRLRERGVSPATVHQAYRTLKTFTRWLEATDALGRNPLAGLSIRTPTTLPQVPTKEELRAALACCPGTFEGTRNRALILVMADAGLRAGEVVRLLVEDWSPQERSLFLRTGKGGKDRVSFVGATTTRAIRDYFTMRPLISREDWLFANAQGGLLTTRYLVHILHRLSTRTGLPPNRRLHPHSLRHLAATSWLRNGVGLDQVRRLLGHASLHTTLRYSNLVAADLQQAHREASAIERIGLTLGRGAGPSRHNRI